MKFIRCQICFGASALCWPAHAFVWSPEPAVWSFSLPFPSPQIVLCPCPTGATLRARAWKFPAAVNCAAIDRPGERREALRAAGGPALCQHEAHWGSRRGRGTEFQAPRSSKKANGDHGKIDNWISWKEQCSFYSSLHTCLQCHSNPAKSWIFMVFHCPVPSTGREVRGEEERFVIRSTAFAESFTSWPFRILEIQNLFNPFQYS